MQSGRAMPAGSSRVERLDPFALPVRFQASDARADEQVRFVELHRERVIMRRAVSGMRMAVSLPLTSFRGVAIRMVPPQGEDPGAVSVVLEHDDPSLSLPLYSAIDGDDIVAEWQCWGRALALPLLVADPEGGLREPFSRIGAVRIGERIYRRNRRAAIRKRRPSILMRRKPGHSGEAPNVHRGEREIIART